MIITKTPLRVSLVGGGTDLPAFSKYHGGAVVSFSIDKYIYIHVNRPFENKVRVSYSKTENALLARDISHELVRNSLEFAGITHRIEVVSISDIPGEGSGLGSSSAFTVGLLNALNQHNILHQLGKKYTLDVAKAACEVEINMCGKNVGKQDQYAVTYGGLNHFLFNKDGTVEIKRIQLKKDDFEQLNKKLMLFYTGKKRQSSTVLDKQTDNIRSHDNVVYMMEKMRDMAMELYQELLLGNIDSVGDYLHRNWMMKRQLADNISDPQIDEWYKIARDSGATGGKLCGAGGGGFMLFFAPAGHRRKIADKLPLRQVPFNISRRGTELIYMEGFNG